MNPLAQHWIYNVIAQSPVAQACDITLRDADIDTITADLPYADSLTTTPGLLHGGVIASLIDIAGAAASATGVSPDDNTTGGATSNMTVNYLAPARTGLTATGTVLHRTRSGTLTDVRVHDADGTLVATGMVNSRFFR